MRVGGRKAIPFMRLCDVSTFLRLAFAQPHLPPPLTVPAKKWQTTTSHHSPPLAPFLQEQAVVSSVLPAEQVLEVSAFSSQNLQEEQVAPSPQ